MAKQKATSVSKRPSLEQAEKFDMLSPMLSSLLEEMRELSKKKPEGLLNLVKVRMINRILAEIRKILADDTSVQYLDPLDEDTLPQNSDAVLVLGQYQSAMGQFKKKHYSKKELFDPPIFEGEWLIQDDK